MTTCEAASDVLARRLATAQRSLTRLETLEAGLIPADAQAAFDVQHRTLALLHQPIAGWKVGAKSVVGPIQGAPLPADRVLGNGGSVRRSDFLKIGLELEIAFRFGRVFEPLTGPHTDEVVLAALSSMLATIEVVASRYAHWPAVDKLAQLADCLNHGALACGEAVAYDATYPFISPAMTFTFNGADVIKGNIANPCGDPRRLLSWVVNHCVRRGISFVEEIVVTAGSYTGLYFPKGPGIAIGKIAGLPPVRLELL